MLLSAEGAIHRSLRHPPRACRSADEAGRWPARAKTIREPRALPWAGMRQAFGLNAPAVASQRESPSRQAAENVGNDKGFCPRHYTDLRAKYSRETDTRLAPNPKGWQRVAGGRSGARGRTTTGSAPESGCTPKGVPERLAPFSVWGITNRSRDPLASLRDAAPLPALARRSRPLPPATSGYLLPTLRVGPARSN